MIFNGFNVIEAKEFYSTEIQARKHRSKRINKKWLKRYGVKTTLLRVKGYDPNKILFFGGNYFIPTKTLELLKNEGVLI